MWSSEDNFQESVPSFYHRIQVVRLTQKSLSATEPRCQPTVLIFIRSVITVDQIVPFVPIYLIGDAYFASEAASFGVRTWVY